MAAMEGCEDIRYYGLIRSILVGSSIISDSLHNALRNVDKDDETISGALMAVASAGDSIANAIEYLADAIKKKE